MYNLIGMLKPDFDHTYTVHPVALMCLAIALDSNR